MARRQFLLVFCIALLPYAWLTHRFDWLCDDAFISFRYAQHLAEGHGLRYNVGEQPPVEGYSNFLWVLALAPFEAMGWPSPAPSRLLSVVCGIVLLFRLAVFLARRLALNAAAVTVAVLFFATLPPIAMWSTSGLETMAFALLVFTAFESLARPGHLPTALSSCVGLLLIRAEGFAWVGVLIALATLDAWLRRDRSATRPLALSAAVATAAAVALVTFRLWYFGYPLPNTAYAKVGFSWLSLERGARYVASYLLTFPHLALILLAAVAWAIIDHKSRRLLWQPLLIATAFYAYAVVAGGDFMPMGRMLVPALPFLAVALGLLVHRIATTRWVAATKRVAPRQWLVAGLAVIVTACSLLPAYNRHLVPTDVRRQLHFRWNMNKFDSEIQTWRRMRNRVAIGIDLARVLSAYTLPGESLPYGRIGALGYYSKLFILDQNGLVNLRVARRPPSVARRSAGHDKHVSRVHFLKDRPTYYLARIEQTLPEEGRLEHVRELLHLDRLPAVGAAYAPLYFPVQSRYGEFLLLAKRKDLIP